MICLIDTAAGARYYYFYDGLGSVAALSNANNAIIEAYCYDAFGRTKINTTAGPDGNWLTPDGTPAAASGYGNRFMFTGREYDSETDLYSYRARMYSPALGRFLQPDPIGYADSMNLYQYCGNNPINWIDPWGLSPLYIPDNDNSGGGEGGQAFSNLSKTECPPECQPKGLGQKIVDFFKNAWKKARGQADDAVKTSLREQYKKDIANKIPKAVEEMEKQGKNAEEIARKVYQLRRDIQIQYRQNTPKEMLDKIYQRNLEKYGDKNGPSIEWLRKAGKSWEDIINSAGRTGGQDLGL